MSLYSDRLTPSPADVISEDADLSNALAANCQSNTSLVKLCSEAYSQCASIIASKLQSVIGATNFNPSGGATSLHNSAVIWGVRAQSNVVRLRMGQIVVDDLYMGDGAGGVSLHGPLHEWLKYWAIVLGYRRLIARVDPSLDRFRVKYDLYNQLTAGEKWSLLRSTGIPYVRVPFPAPGAIYEPGVGVWSADNVSMTTVSGPKGGDFKVAITWVDQSSQLFYVSPTMKNNAESGPSSVFPAQFQDGLLQVNPAADQVISIDITSLNPPTGAVSLPEASITGVSQGTRVATGWNVYVGVVDTDPAPLYLQNATPLPVGTKTYTLTTDPVLSGFTMGRGQYPDANMPMGDLMMRM